MLLAEPTDRSRIIRKHTIPMKRNSTPDRSCFGRRSVIFYSSSYGFPPDDLAKKAGRCCRRTEQALAVMRERVGTESLMLGISGICYCQKAPGALIQLKIASPPPENHNPIFGLIFIVLRSVNV
jgi:hypothetical protein